MAENMNKSSVATKMILTIVFVTLVVASVTSFIILRQDYEKEMRSVDKTMNGLRKVLKIPPMFMGRCSTDASVRQKIKDGHEIEIERQCQQQRAVGYHLQPYFGGRQVAPHDIQIKVSNVTDDFPEFEYVREIYPNPIIDGHLFVEVIGLSNILLGYEIYDITGRLIQTISPQLVLNGQITRTKIELISSIASGTYLLYPFQMDEDGNRLVDYDPRKNGAVKKFIIP